MRAEVEDIGPCKKKLTIEVSGEEVNEAIRTSFNEIRRNAIIPGFRKGHAPVELIEKRFGTDLRKEVKANLVFDNYRKAIQEKNIEPAADPDVDIDALELKEGEPLKFDVTLEVWPQFEPAGYEGMKLEKPSTEPAPEEIEAEIGNLRTRTTTFDDIKDEGALETDFLISSYEMTSGGETVASAKEAGLRPADSTVRRVKIEGLKVALVGKKAGDKVTLDFKVDAEHPDEKLRGKDATIAIDIKSVRRPRVPEATDAWAKELGFASLEELKTVIGRNVAAAKETQAEEALKAQIHDKLVAMLTFDLPADMVRRQQTDIIRRERQALMYRGATEDDLSKVSDTLETASLERAEKDLKFFFILSRIADKEGIKAASADIDMKVAELAARYRMTTGKMRERLAREEMLPQIALQIREEKTLSHILSKAEITEAAAPQGAPEEAQTKEQPKKPRVSKGEGEEKEEEGPKEK